MIRHWLWLLWTWQRRRDTRDAAEGTVRLRLHARAQAAAEEVARKRIEGRWAVRDAELQAEWRAHDLRAGYLLHCLWRWTLLKHASRPALHALPEGARRRRA